MSLPRPFRPYHFHADLIWWDGPFNWLEISPILGLFPEHFLIPLRSLIVVFIFSKYLLEFPEISEVEGFSILCDRRTE